MSCLDWRIIPYNLSISWNPFKGNYISGAIVSANKIGVILTDAVSTTYLQIYSTDDIKYDNGFLHLNETPTKVIPIAEKATYHNKSFS